MSYRIFNAATALGVDVKELVQGQEKNNLCFQIINPIMTIPTPQQL